MKYFVDIHLTSGGKLLKKILNKFDKQFYQSNIRKVHTMSLLFLLEYIIILRKRKENFQRNLKE